MYLFKKQSCIINILVMLEVKHVFLIHWWSYSRSVDSSVNMPLRSGGPLVPLLYKCYLRKFKLSRSSFQTQPTFGSISEFIVAFVLIYIAYSTDIWAFYFLHFWFYLVALSIFSERYNWAWSNLPSVFYGIVERVTCFRLLDQKTGEADFINTGHLEMDYLKHFLIETLLCL